MSELDAFKVDLFELSLEVIKVAQEMPEHRYTNTDAADPEDSGCSYSHEDGTGCIVGTAMRRLGKPVLKRSEANKLDYMDERRRLMNAYVSHSAWAYILDGDKESDDYIAVYAWLMRAQSKQDDRVAWKVAIETADAEHPRGAQILRNMMQDAS